MRAATPLVLAVLLAGCLGNLPVPAAEDLTPNEGVTPLLGPDYVAALALAAEAGAASGDPVTVYASRVADAPMGLSNGLFAPAPYALLLRPSVIVTNASWAEIDGVRAPFPDVKVYEGEVADVPGSVVRLVVTDEWARGSITVPDQLRGQRAGEITALIRYNLNGNLPHGTLEPGGAGGAAGGFAALSDEPIMYDAPGWEEQECVSLVPTALQPRVVSTGTLLDDMLPADARETGTITARIVMDADGYASQMLGRHTFPVLVSMLAETDAIYHNQLGIRLELVGVHAHTDPAAIGNWTTNGGFSPQFETLSAYWNAREDVDRDVVHLLGGEDTGYGIANCIGGAGIPQIGYTFTPLPWEQRMPVFHTTAIAHELGHIFNAHHHYGNHVETEGRGGTLMIQGYTPGARPVFGTLERATIRGWAEEYIDAASR